MWKGAQGISGGLFYLSTVVAWTWNVTPSKGHVLKTWSSSGSAVEGCLDCVIPDINGLVGYGFLAVEEDHLKCAFEDCTMLQTLGPPSASWMLWGKQPFSVTHSCWQGVPYHHRLLAMGPDDCGAQPQKPRSKVNPLLKCSSLVFVTVRKSLMDTGTIS